MSWTHYSILRMILGIYLVVHFITVMPDAPEIFSSDGVITTKELLPAYNLPLHIFTYDSASQVTMFMATLVISSVFLAIGFYPKISALWTLYGWICLFNRNPFISNPGLPYIGWILLSISLVPSYHIGWKFPKTLYYGFWLISALSYTISGIHKLQCPSWIDGTALEHVFSGLLSRNNLLSEFMLQYPFLLKIMTWSSLFGEISFLFLGLFKRLRPLYWLMFLSLHLGILATVNFTDLTFGMLVAHMFLFDIRWFKEPVRVKKSLSENNLQEVKSKAEDTKVPFHVWGIYILVISVVYAITMEMFVDTGFISYMFDFAVSSTWGFVAIMAGMAGLMVLESIYPDQRLYASQGWMLWAIGINIFQLISAIAASYTWEKWLYNYSLLHETTGINLRSTTSPFIGAIIAYVLNQWVFYWWHYMRHQIEFLWVFVHQFHHSPRRIETITSFYKHPLEIVLDSQIMAIVLYPVLGLSPESSIWLSIFSAFGEYFYHMNIKTPKFIGYFFQRPESHRLHHNYNCRLNCPNNSDLVIFDILNDTFENPERMDRSTGFTNEAMRLEMLSFKNVITGKYYQFSLREIAYVILVAWGLFASTFFFIDPNISKQSSVFVSSPYPIVFSAYNGVETFSTNFSIYTTGTFNITDLELTHELYSQLDGSYNKRNVYGAIFAYGPLFRNSVLVALRDEIMNYAVCDPGDISQKLGFGKIDNLSVKVQSKTLGNTGTWWLNVTCS